MTIPASRIGDNHICPMSTGGVPHVGGPVTSGAMGVLICNVPAARTTDQALCTGPTDMLVVGAATVWIENQMAARIASNTMHGGAVVEGCPTVLIGGPSAGALIGSSERARLIFRQAAEGRDSLDDRQTYQNCGVEASRELILASGGNATENDLLDWAIDENLAGNDPDPLERGGTHPEQREQILDRNGVPSHREEQNMTNITQAVSEGRGVITSHDAGTLWNDPGVVGGHAVTATGIQYDADGNVESVIINDTGNGHEHDSIPADRFEDSLRPGRDINVTDNPVY